LQLVIGLCIDVFDMVLLLKLPDFIVYGDSPRNAERRYYG